MGTNYDNTPSGSNKARESTHINAKITNPLVTRERSELEKAIFVDDIKGAVEDAFMKKVVPSLRDSALNGLHALLDSMFAGKGRSVSGSSGYADISRQILNTGTRMVDYNRNQQQNVSSINAPVHGTLLFNCEEDAMLLLSKMKQAIEDGGWVSVLTVYSWIGENIGHTYANFGWSSTAGARITHTSDGWELKLPRAVQVQREG